MTICNQFTNSFRTIEAANHTWLTMGKTIRCEREPATAHAAMASSYVALNDLERLSHPSGRLDKFSYSFVQEQSNLISFPWGRLLPFLQLFHTWIALILRIFELPCRFQWNKVLQRALEFWHQSPLPAVLAVVWQIAFNSSNGAVKELSGEGGSPAESRAWLMPRRLSSGYPDIITRKSMNVSITGPGGSLIITVI